MDEFLKPIEWAQKAKRIAVKVGTSVLTDPRQGGVTERGIQRVASQVAALWKEKREVVVVTSGAIGVGMGILGLRARPSRLPKLQAAAATGQGLLMRWYTAHLKEEGFDAAQILLTRGDLEDRRRYKNARATLLTLLQAGIVPIINENDTVSVEEIRYGDNDILCAQVATLIDADLLVLLSDVGELAGLRTPTRIFTQVTPELERLARGRGTPLSTGGMHTKLEAAKIATASGIPMVLMNGLRGDDCLVDFFLKGEDHGTWFLPRKEAAVKGRHRWMAFTGNPKGILLVDAGAREALIRHPRSLLASGVKGVEGNFRGGDLVSVCESARHREFARGIVRYSHEEISKIKGLKSEEISEILGRKAQEVIHRDQLVILRGPE